MQGIEASDAWDAVTECNKGIEGSERRVLSSFSIELIQHSAHSAFSSPEPCPALACRGTSFRVRPFGVRACLRRHLSPVHISAEASLSEASLCGGISLSTSVVTLRLSRS